MKLLPYEFKLRMIFRARDYGGNKTSVIAAATAAKGGGGHLVGIERYAACVVGPNPVEIKCS